MSVKSITIIAVTVAALFAAVGTAYRLDAREAKKPYPKATPPPPPSPVFTELEPLVVTEADFERLDRDHNAQLEHEVERALAGNDPQQRETVFTFLVPELLQLEPERLVGLWARQEGAARTVLLEELAGQWVRRDRDATIGWMKSIEDEAERVHAAKVAVDSLAPVAPQDAIYVAQQFDVGRDNGYLERLVQLWAESSMDDAERWLATQPDDARTAPLRARIERVRDQKKSSERG
jgi:DNA-binding transcriptional regulator YbjK